MKTNKKKAKSGMSDAARADWRASKSADLGRANALKKLAATPDPSPKAKKPRAFPAPADAPTAPTTPIEADTPAPVAEVAAAAPDGPTTEVAADGANAAPTGDSNAAPAAGQGEDGGKPDKPNRTRKTPGERKPREGGCLNIAAKLLAQSTEPMTAKAMINQMAAKGLWTTPGGKTPAATLYAAIIREIRDKGDAARFRKMDRGLFAAPTGTAAKN